MDGGVKQTSPFRYAIGMFGTSIPINMFRSFAFIFYVDNLGLNTELFALVIFLYTFLDAIDNPIYGFLSDRTRTRWGRRRPWLVIGTPLMVLSFVLFFHPFNYGTENGLFVHFLLTYLLTGTLDSLINANYGALFPELFKTDGQRAKTNAMRQAFQLVAMMISIALTPMVTSAIGYGWTSVIYGALALGVILYCTLGCHESAPEELSEKPKLFSSLKAILTNKKFWIFGAANAFYSTALSLVQASVPFYVKYALGLGSMESTLLLAAVLLVAVAGVAVWVKMVKHFGLMRVWRAALLFLAAAFIPLYFMNSFIGALIATLFVGFGMSGVLTTMDLIGARIMDEDSQKYGVRREGLYSSVGGFLNRLNGFFISFAYLMVKVLYGYESGDVPGGRPGDAARFLLIIFPFVAMVLSCATSRFLHFPQKDNKDA